MSVVITMYNLRRLVREVWSCDADKLAASNTVLSGRLRKCGDRISSLLALVIFALGSVFAAAQSPACAPNTAVFPCVYVANGGSDTLSVISASTNKVIGTITVGNSPQGMAITPDNKSVYVANDRDFTVTVIDTATGVVTATISGLTGQVPSQVAITPDGKFAYVAEPGSDFSAVDQIDIASNTVTNSVSGTADPTAIVFAPDGKLAYVSDECFMVSGAGFACVDVVDTTSTPPTVMGNPIGIANSGFSEGSGIAITPDGSLICVSFIDANFQLEIALISTANNTVTPLGLNMTSDLTNYGLGMMPNGTLYVAEPGNSDVPLNTVASIKTGVQSQLSIPVGNGPTGVAIGPGGNSVYVSNAVDGTVSIIDAATNNVLTLGSANGFINPQGVAAMSAIPPVIATQPASQTILTTQTATISVVATSLAPVTYQWYEGLAGDLSAPIEGAIGSSFTTPPLNSTVNYWVQVANVAGAVNSNTATVTVTTNQPPTCTLSVEGAGSQSFTNPLKVIATATCIDPQGEALTTTINFGDGVSSSGANSGVFTATHTYAAVTQRIPYTIQVSATDSSGLQSAPTFYSWDIVPTTLAPPVFSGQSSVVTVTLASPSGAPELVQFECTTITTTVGSTPAFTPASDLGISCSSNPQTITLSAVSQAVTIVIQTTGAATAQTRGMRQGRLPYGFWVPLPFFALVFIGVGFKSMRSCRCRFSWSVVLSGLCILAFLSVSCGGGFTAPKVLPVTPPGNYQITVIDLPVESSSGFEQTSLIVPLSVSPFQ